MKHLARSIRWTAFSDRLSPDLAVCLPTLRWSTLHVMIWLSIIAHLSVDLFAMLTMRPVPRAIGWPALQCLGRELGELADLLS